MTYKEFMALPDDGKRYELIEGELVLNPAPATRHQTIQWRISGELYKYFEGHPIGRAFNAPFDVVLSEDVVLEPDVLIVLNEHASIIGAENVKGAPDIAVEILSPRTRRRDEGAKRRLYEEHGVAEYWMVDPDAERVLIWSNEIGGTITSPLLPGFSLDVRQVFAE